MSKDEKFVRDWIERERGNGLVDIKLYPHDLTTDEGIAAMAAVFRDIDAGK